MSINLSKKDIIWGYFAQFFSIASGIIVLPLILHLLSPEEIGMNYLMLTVGSMVSLFDFGFGPQFGRNITYIFSGAQELKKEGVNINENERRNKQINYRLLSTMVYTARFVYRRLSFTVLLFMLSVGTLYIYNVTNGFTTVHNALLIWIIYSVSTYFNIYFTYYSSLLIGKGLIMESKKAMVFSRVIYIFLSIILLKYGVGLLSIAIANLIAPFIERYISYNFFFTKELNEKLDCYIITKEEKLDLFEIIWHNAKKLGLVFIGSYAISRFAMFLAGLYLPLSVVASYGLMMQLVGLIYSIASTLFNIYNPRFAALKMEGRKSLLIKDFAYSMGVYYLLFIIGGIFLLFFVPDLLKVIKSNAILPSFGIILLYLIFMLLEGNHSNFSTLIVIGNTVPFLWVSLITGCLISLGSYFSLSFTNLGIMGLILVQGIVQLAYSNWKWPLVVLIDFRINIIQFISLAFSEVNVRLKSFFLTT